MKAVQHTTTADSAALDEMARSSMKQPRDADTFSDDLRPEYHREDFGAMVRGKYVSRLREASNVVVLDSQIAEVFPNPNRPEPPRR